MTALLKPYDGAEPSGAELRMLERDSQLIIVAGSDTTASALTHIIYELVSHPSHISKLRKEFPSVEASICPSTIDHLQLQRLDHRNGVINESLHLHPPVPYGQHHLTPPEGLTIGGVLILASKVYTIPESFIPGRWYSNPELIKERSAFAPFSTGTYGCIGRRLSLLNIRTLIAKLLLTYNLAFGVGETGRGIEEDSQERFTLAHGDLHITFAGI